MRGFWFLPGFAVLLGAAGPPGGAAGGSADWPCMQRLVPTLTAGAFWTGPTVGDDWRSDPRVADVVAQVAPRSRTKEDGVAALKAFAASIPTPERATTFARVFAGLVEETNAQRSQVIDRLHGMARRQHDLTGTVAQATSQLQALPPDAPQAEREEIASRRSFLIRDFDGVGRTIRYACEVPVELESRLGAFAETLQAALGS